MSRGCPRPHLATATAAVNSTYCIESMSRGCPRPHLATATAAVNSTYCIESLSRGCPRPHLATATAAVNSTYCIDSMSRGCPRPHLATATAAVNSIYCIESMSRGCPRPDLATATAAVNSTYCIESMSRGCPRLDLATATAAVNSTSLGYRRGLGAGAGAPHLNFKTRKRRAVCPPPLLSRLLLCLLNAVQNMIFEIPFKLVFVWIKKQMFTSGQVCAAVVSQSCVPLSHTHGLSHLHIFSLLVLLSFTDCFTCHLEPLRDKKLNNGRHSVSRKDIIISVLGRTCRIWSAAFRVTSFNPLQNVGSSPTRLNGICVRIADHFDGWICRSWIGLK
ncbi:hypothetical protein J6590_038549 [Homalodisca vitripennis]|nr:hypothetical protein J6590_038549 [Homalodisca vitripennis]